MIRIWFLLVFLGEKMETEPLKYFFYSKIILKGKRDLKKDIFTTAELYLWGLQKVIAARMPEGFSIVFLLQALLLCS